MQSANMHHDRLWDLYSSEVSEKGCPTPLSILQSFYNVAKQDAIVRSPASAVDGRK